MCGRGALAVPWHAAQVVLNPRTGHQGVGLQSVVDFLHVNLAYPRNMCGTGPFYTWQESRGNASHDDFVWVEGACAVVVAGVLEGKTDRNTRVDLPGGPLQIEWRESDGHVYMTGPAELVFAGSLTL